MTMTETQLVLHSKPVSAVRSIRRSAGTAALPPP